MAIVQNILTNLRTDLLTIDGSGYTNTISKAFKSLRFVGDLTDSDFDACYVGVGRENVTTLDDRLRRCELIVFGLIYFNISTDTQNAGTLESQAETYREDLYILNELWTNTLGSLDTNSKRCVESCDITSITPYINTGSPDRGEVEFELRIIYYRG